MIDIKKILTIFLILMLVIPSVYAADTKKADGISNVSIYDHALNASERKQIAEGKVTEKDNKPITDDTKEKETKITNKDKSITGDIKVTTKDVSKFSVKKKSNYEISISKSGEHVKAKVSFPKSELQKIDIDKDGKFGLLHISDTGEVTHTTATEAELVAGKVMTFSTNIVNGYSGYKQYTFSDVKSGDTLNIDDVDGNYTITAAVDGVVPSYIPIIETNYSTYPSNPLFVLPLNSDGLDISGNMYNYTVGSGITYVPMHIGNGTYRVPENGYLTAKKSTNITGNFSISLWLNMYNDAHDNYIQFVRGGSPVTGLFWTQLTNKIYYQWKENNVVKSYIFPTPLQENKIYNIQVKRGGNNITIMVDGNIGIGSIVKSDENNFPLSMLNEINGTVDQVVFYDKYINTSDSMALYAGGSGISFRPKPSYNWTGYNVASGVEKVLDTDSTCTGIEYVDTTGGTHDVTITVYFTEDITEITNTYTALVQTVNITHTSTNTADNGSISYEILDGYDGVAVLSSNNTNASISRNATHFTISTGYLAAGSTYYYNVEIPVVRTSFVNPSATVAVVVTAAGAFVGGSFINKWYRRRRGS